jgi:hypothetical protein
MIFEISSAFGGKGLSVHVPASSWEPNIDWKQVKKMKTNQFGPKQGKNTSKVQFPELSKLING